MRCPECAGQKKRGAKKDQYRLPTQLADSDSPPTVLETALPPMLWLLFFAYPLVTNVAFAAFPCYELDSGSWLRADVAIECGSAAHAEAKLLALVAIILYPIGLPLISFILLLQAREAIHGKEATPLSKAIAFLWREFKPELWWWEVVELLKRVVLVGLMQLVWYGEVLQVLLGTLLAMSFLLFQLAASPYADPSLNLVASISSYCLVVFFFMCIALKYSSLTDTADIAEKMSEAQEDVYTYDAAVLTALTLASIFASVIIAGAMTLQNTFVEAKRIMTAVKKLKRRALRKQLQGLVGRDEDKKVLIDGLDKMDQPGSKLAAASGIFGKHGLHPMYWGVSKSDLIEFREQVRKAVANHEIENFTPSHLPQYAQKKFDDPLVGPNMHQVNAGFIKPFTLDGTRKEPTFLPGLSYGLLRNYATGGLPCELFFSHAWDEGVYELIENALNAWPDGCEGAYICCLSNPQNLDIGKLVGGEVDNSPFAQILTGGKVQNFVMLSNSNTPIHSRRWCIFEAFKAQKQGIPMGITGDPIHLLMGDKKDELLKLERAAHKQRELQLKSVQGDLESVTSSPELISDANAIDRRLSSRLEQLREAAETLAAAKIEILNSDNVDLINFELSKCSFKSDEDAICEAINGCEEQIEALVCSLVRDCFCGVSHVTMASASHAPGSLQLSVVDNTVDLSRMQSLEGSPLLMLQFIGWLRLRPKVQTLLVEPAQLTSEGVQQLRLAIEGGLLSGLNEITPIGDINGELNHLVAVVTTKAKTRAEARLHTEYTVTFSPGPLGVSMVRGDDDRVKIDAVQDGMQAKALGVRPNSVVLQVSGQAVDGLGYESVRSMILQSKQRPLTLVLGHEASPSGMRFHAKTVSDLESSGSGSSKKAVGKRFPIAFRFGGSTKKEPYPAADVPNYSSQVATSLSTTGDYRASMDQDELALAGIVVGVGDGSSASPPKPIWASIEAGTSHGHDLNSLRETFDNEENGAATCITPRLSRTSSASL